MNRIQNILDCFREITQKIEIEHPKKIGNVCDTDMRLCVRHSDVCGHTVRAKV
jgi:hypothetical protein